MINLYLSHSQIRRELLLITGILLHGIGNWKKIAEHVGTRTKEEVELHYRHVYIASEDWPMPVSTFNVFIHSLRFILAYGYDFQR